MLKKAIKMVRGYLTKKDMEMLQQASKRQLKHKKVFPKKFSCGSCSYMWFYQSIKCPSCTAATIKQMG